ncbi:MAG: histidine ammonia-lyase [Actinobacteria bacterium]|nr:histidine ammonia-lyase [Actinomycetota bacterium]
MADPHPPVVLAVDGASRGDVLAVARAGARVEVSDEARAAMAASRDVVAGYAASGTPVYGVSTGFGGLASTYIPADRREELQESIVRSHAAGMGDPVEVEVARAMVFLRARSLAMGRSGIRPEVVDAMLALLNAGYTPLVPEHGSLGASGDLAPLAHGALVLLGEGAVRGPDGVVVPAGEALAAVGLAPLHLEAKEGLALVNGTDGILGQLVMALDDLDVLLRTADVVAGMTVEGLLGTDRAFAADLLAMRPQVGQAVSAANLRQVLADSAIVASHRGEDDPRVQDAYSLRCTPQVHGAARDTLAFAGDIADRELRAAIDNPVVLPDGRVESCGNFHGAPLGFAADFLAIAAAEVGAIAERRVDRMLDRTRSAGLPPFLAVDAGVRSGFMIAHYTAVAMCTENRRLAAPASVDSLPTSAMQEDHVSMAWSAARKLRTVVTNLGRILAVELLAATQAIELRAPLTPAPVTAAVVARVRREVPPYDTDRHLAPELATAAAMVTDGAVLAAAEEVCGRLP